MHFEGHCQLGKKNKENGLLSLEKVSGNILARLSQRKTDGDHGIKFSLDL